MSAFHPGQLLALPGMIYDPFCGADLGLVLAVTPLGASKGDSWITFLAQGRVYVRQSYSPTMVIIS